MIEVHINVTSLVFSLNFPLQPDKEYAEKDTPTQSKPIEMILNPIQSSVIKFFMVVKLKEELSFNVPLKPC